MNVTIVKSELKNKAVLPFVSRSKRKISKFHVPTFDSMCCNKRQTVFRTDGDTHKIQRAEDTGCLNLYATVGMWVFLPPLVPGSRRPAGAVTRGCGAPMSWAAVRRGSISESSADASLFSWCRTLPPPGGHWLKLHRQMKTMWGTWQMLFT